MHSKLSLFFAQAVDNDGDVITIILLLSDILFEELSPFQKDWWDGFNLVIKIRIMDASLNQLLTKEKRNGNESQRRIVLGFYSLATFSRGLPDIVSGVIAPRHHLECWMRLIVILVCESSGKSSDTPASTLRKWALKLHMATSAAFRQWYPGGTNSMLNLCGSQMWFFVFSETLLSSTCFFRTMPTQFNQWRSTSYARIISASLQLFMGLTRMALRSISTITIMSFLPHWKRVGNWPIWLENVVSQTLYVLVYTLHTFLPWSWEKLHVLNEIGHSLVEHTFFLVWF